MNAVLQFPIQEEIVICKHCGNVIEDGYNYCGICGNPKEKKTKKAAPKTHNTKHAIKEQEWINKIQHYLLNKPDVRGKGNKKFPNCRNEAAFMFGIAVGLRSSDLLALRVKDVISAKDNDLYVVEQKTGKGRVIRLSPEIAEMIAKYVNKFHLHEDDLLFPKHLTNKTKIDVCSWNRIIREAGKAVGYPKSIGGHTLRKTFGYRTYQAALQTGVENGYRALSMLCKIFGHSSELITLRYIGIEEEEERELYALVTQDCNLNLQYEDD